jgi:exonuclease III
MKPSARISSAAALHRGLEPAVQCTSVLCWNVRGLNKRARRDNVRTLVDSVRANVVCLVETKPHDVNQWVVAATLGMNYSEFA